MEKYKIKKPKVYGAVLEKDCVEHYFWNYEDAFHYICSDLEQGFDYDFCVGEFGEESVTISNIGYMYRLEIE